MARVRLPRLTLLGRLILFLLAFGVSLLLELGISRYQSQYVLAPMQERTENIQTISLFLNGAERCMAALDDYRWDYGNAETLIANIETSLAETARLADTIRMDVREVSEEYYLLANAARTTYGTLTEQLREIEAQLSANQSARAAQLYYQKAQPCGGYLLQYTRELSERAILDNNDTYAALNARNDRLKRLEAAR